MPDIFNRAGSDFGGSFAADDAKIVFSGPGGTTIGQSGGVGLLTQNLSFNYAQQVTRLYEVGSNYSFYVAGRAQGNMGLGRVLGPRAVQTAFYRNYGDVCNAANNNINLLMASGCATNSNGGVIGNLGQIAFLIKSLILTSIAITVGAQDMVVSEQLGAMFMSLELAGS